MSNLVIEGGHPLHGEVKVPGSKNAVTPILAATLLTEEECVLHNVPNISDVDKMLKLLQELGAEVKQEGTTVIVKASHLELKHLEPKLVKGMRSSVLMFGPLLARLGEVRLPEPGGCIIGNRPLGAHLQGLAQLGVSVVAEDDVYHLKTKKLIGTNVVLPEFSVTATENIIMAAVLAQGTTIIDLAAAEPHVQDLCKFLLSMGAKISGFGTHRIIIEGVDKLHGTVHQIVPDYIEAGTWAVLAAVSRGELSISPVIPDHLALILLKLKEIGVLYELKDDTLIVRASRQLKPFKLQAMPYPGFPTDLQAPFSVLATQASGTSLVHDPLYEGRMNHITELIKMGANALIADPHRVVITGPTPLYGREIRSFDLRAGATLVIAGLIAQGETIINDAEVIDRGYERIDERLKTVGAHLRRE
jgi:UDP-N-acetylglucosamine 1-carboxyvinyltransferase